MAENRPIHVRVAREHGLPTPVAVGVVTVAEGSPAAVAGLQPRDEDGEPNSPELQLKLHECFSAKDHPHLCEAKLPVKLWLCSPDGKRIESTFHWPAFRTNTYPKLKPALQKKFPAVLWV